MWQWLRRKAAAIETGSFGKGRGCTSANVAVIYAQAGLAGERLRRVQEEDAVERAD